MRVTKLTQQRNVHVQVPHGAENQSLTEKLLCRSRLLGFEADVCASVESDIIKSRWPQVSMLRVVTGNELPVSILKPLRLLHPNNSSCSFILSPKDWMCRRAEQNRERPADRLTQITGSIYSKKLHEISLSFSSFWLRL